MGADLDNFQAPKSSWLYDFPRSCVLGEVGVGTDLESRSSNNFSPYHVLRLTCCETDVIQH